MTNVTAETCLHGLRGDTFDIIGPQQSCFKKNDVAGDDIEMFGAQKCRIVYFWCGFSRRVFKMALICLLNMGYSPKTIENDVSGKPIFYGPQFSDIPHFSCLDT